MKVEDFFRFVTPEVAGAPDELLRQAIMFTANRFCTETHVWDVISDPIDLIDGQPDYDMDIVPGGEAITVKAVWTAGRELRPVTMSELFSLMPNWQEATGSEPSFYNMVKGFGTLTVYPTPKEPLSARLTFHSVYAPPQTGNILPDILVRDYLDAIAGGAKARLMAMHGQTWTNLQQAAIYKQWLDNEIVNAKIDVAHNRVPGSIRVRPLRFGG